MGTSTSKVSGANVTPGETAGGQRRAAHPAQKSLLWAGFGITVGSFMPWLTTGLDVYSGFQGAGRFTFYFGIIAIAGGLMPWRTLAAVHAIIAASAAIALPVWQIARLFNKVGFSGWTPGIGLMVVLFGGLVCASVFYRLLFSSRSLS